MISKFHGDTTVHFENVMKKPEGTYDYVVCCNKALDPDGLPDAVSGAITAGKTAIVLIQNGIGAEDPFVRKYPDNSVITCVAWTGAKQIEQGVIEQLTADKLSFGLYHGSKEKLHGFEALLQGYSYEIPDNILYTRWEKLVWNAAWNSLTALTQLNTKNWLESSPEALETTRVLMKEVMAVAEKKGIAFDDNLPDQLIEKVQGLGGVISSMMTDVREGRPGEVEVILGNPLRYARELGLSTPVLTTLYSLMKAQNYRLTEILPKGLPY